VKLLKSDREMAILLKKIRKIREFLLLFFNFNFSFYNVLDVSGRGCVCLAFLDILEELLVLDCHLGDTL
jgi:hypothetical protein